MTHARTAAATAATVVLLSLLGACGADDPYCVKVEASQSTLDDFGAKKTDAAYASYAKALTSISTVAPSPIDLQWASLARATQGIVKAQDEVGFALQDMNDEDKRTALSEGDVAVLNKAYKRFNSTTSQRKAVVADVLKTCDIHLK